MSAPTLTLRAAPDGPIASVTVNPAGPGPVVQSGYLGLSHEWGQAQMMMGEPSLGTNPIYRQLLANLLAHGGGPLPIRIGGSTTEQTGESDAMKVTACAQLYHDLDGAVRWIPGVNLGKNDIGLAVRQAQTFVDAMPEGGLEAIEMGNQPDFFVFNHDRPEGYSFDDYLVEFRAFSQSIRTAVPAAPPFMAPSLGCFPGTAAPPLVAPNDFGAPDDIARLLIQEGDTLGIVAQHAGGGGIMGTDPYPGFLLEPACALDDPDETEPYIDVAHAWGKPYRIVQMNSIMGSGAAGVNDAFEAALWAVDILFEYASRGVDGVNIHSNVWNINHGFDIHGAFQFDVPEDQYLASNTETPPPAGMRFTDDYELRRVLPLYYGMLFFAEAAANRSQVLPVLVNSTANIKAWATRDPETQAVRVAVLNKDIEAAGTVALTVPGYAQGTVKRLSAPSFSATSGITWGGLTFDRSKDGLPLGKEEREGVEGQDGTFRVAIEAASGILLTLEQ